RGRLSLGCVKPAPDSSASIFRMLLNITVVAGDGIGPEVTAEAIRVLETVAETFGHQLALTHKNIGGAGLRASNDPLPADTIEACLSSTAVLLVAVGRPVLDSY